MGEDEKKCPLCDAGIPISTKIQGVTQDSNGANQRVTLSDSLSDKIRGLLNGTERPRGNPISAAYPDGPEWPTVATTGRLPPISMFEHQRMVLQELGKVPRRVMIFDSMSQSIDYAAIERRVLGFCNLQQVPKNLARAPGMSEWFSRAYGAGRYSSKPTLALGSLLLPMLHSKRAWFEPAETQIALAVRSAFPKFVPVKYPVQVTWSEPKWRP